MFQEFKDFLTKTNALALAVGVIIGAASGKVVSSLVDNIIMPLISMVIPGGNWRTAQLVLGSIKDPKDPTKMIDNAIQYGNFLGSLVDFIVIAFVVFMITKILIKPEPPAGPTKDQELLSEIRDALKKR